MDDERRAYRRVTTLIRGRLRKLEGPEAPALFLGLGDGGAGPDKDALKNSHLPEAVVDFLLDMNAKLDTLISLHSQDKLSHNFPIQVEVTDISGAGLRAKLLPGQEAPPAEGDFVEAVLVLHQFPLAMVGAIGRVTREQCPEGDDCGGGLLAIHFTRMREKDLDRVVSFVFQEERRHIRERKWE